MITLSCQSADFTAMGDHLLIQKKGMVGSMNHLTLGLPGEVRVSYENISGVEVTKPGLLLPGFMRIEFLYEGNEVNYASQYMEKEIFDIAQKLREEIYRRRDAVTQSQRRISIDTGDIEARLARIELLLRNGSITHVEYDTLRVQILGGI